MSLRNLSSLTLADLFNCSPIVPPYSCREMPQYLLSPVSSRHPRVIFPVCLPLRLGRWVLTPDPSLPVTAVVTRSVLLHTAVHRVGPAETPVPGPEMVDLGTGGGGPEENRNFLYIFYFKK